MSSVLVGMFDSDSQAAQARTELMSAGFAASAVTLTGGTEMSSSGYTPASTMSVDEPHHEGAIARFSAICLATATTRVIPIVQAIPTPTTKLSSAAHTVSP